MPKKPVKKPSGAANMREAGRVGLLVAMSKEEREIIRVAAAKNGLASGPWVLKVALEAANSCRK